MELLVFQVDGEFDSERDREIMALQFYKVLKTPIFILSGDLSYAGSTITVPDDSPAAEYWFEIMAEDLPEANT